MVESRDTLNNALEARFFDRLHERQIALVVTTRHAHPLVLFDGLFLGHHRHWEQKIGLLVQFSESQI